MLRFAAAAAMGAATMPAVMRILEARFPQFALTRRSDPRPTLLGRIFLIQAALLALVYLAGAALYLSSSTRVSERGIEHRFLFRTRTFPFEQVARLQILNQRGSNGSGAQKYAIEMRDGTWIYFSLEAEGMTEPELRTITDFVSARSGLGWVPPTEARVLENQRRWPISRRNTRRRAHLALDESLSRLPPTALAPLILCSCNRATPSIDADAK